MINKYKWVFFGTIYYMSADLFYWVNTLTKVKCMNVYVDFNCIWFINIINIYFVMVESLDLLFDLFHISKFFHLDFFCFLLCVKPPCIHN